MKNTSLAIASQKAKIVPPPTKREVASAMLILAKERFDVEKVKEREQFEVLRAARNNEARLALIQYLKKNTAEITVTSHYGGKALLETKDRLDLKHFPALAKAQKAVSEHKSLGWCEADVKKEIREKLDISAARVSALLANPEARAALDKMLDS